MSFNFNKITDRHHTGAVKIDLAVARGKPADVLSLWVADMDFPTSPATNMILPMNVMIW